LRTNEKKGTAEQKKRAGAGRLLDGSICGLIYLMSLEELNRTLMFLRSRAAAERSEIAAPSSLGILLTRIEPVIA
jgi:hypothetical protein